MKISKSLIYAICLIVALALLGCNKLSEQFSSLKPASKKQAFPEVQGAIIAYVNDMPITLEQLEQEIQAFNELMDVPEAKIVTREQKLAYLNEEIVRRYLLYQKAKELAVEKDPKVQELLWNLEVNLLANQLLQKEIDNIVVTSSEVEDFYNLYKDQFRLEEERRIREILVNSEGQANEILIALLQGQDFASLARERSQADSAKAGGDLGFIKKGSRGEEFLRFDEAAFSPSLEAGRISNVFKDKNGYYIIKIEQIKGGQAKAISEVWDDIKANVLFLKRQQRYQELTNKLLESANIVIYKEKIK